MFSNVLGLFPGIGLAWGLLVCGQNGRWYITTKLVRPGVEVSENWELLSPILDLPGEIPRPDGTGVWALLPEEVAEGQHIWKWFRTAGSVVLEN